MDAKVDIPKNGLLSGMILTVLAGVAGVLAAFVDSPIRDGFRQGLTPQLNFFFLISLILMTLHKAESFWFGEYDCCPVYLTSGQASWSQNPRQAIFLSFVPTFVGMMFMVYFAFQGPPWHLILIAIWIGQGLHEIHHVAKSAARKNLYPGSLTSLLFVGVVSLGIFPLWHDLLFVSRGAFFYGYYAGLPLVFLAFYIEDKGWTARTPVSIWAS